MIEIERTYALADINSKLPVEKVQEEGLTRLCLKKSKSLVGFKRKFTIVSTQEYIDSVEVKIAKPTGLSEGTRDLKSVEEGIPVPSFDKRFHHEDE